MTTGQKRALSGMQPSGLLHLGNWLGALENWNALQEQYECFFFVADWHALSSNYADTSRIREYVRELLIDWLAAGIDPKRATVFVQSHVKFFLSRWPKLTRVYPDTAGADLLLKSLQQLGYQCYPAVKDRAYGMNLLAGLIEIAAITIHESNENSISEFNSYSWLERTDPNDRTRYKTATPVDNHADAMDARRYAVASFTRLLERQVAGGYQTPRDRQFAGYKPQSRAVSLSWR